MFFCFLFLKKRRLLITFLKFITKNKQFQIAKSNSTVAVLESDNISVDNYNTHTDRALKLLGFRTTVELNDGLARFVASYPFGDALCPILRNEK